MMGGKGFVELAFNPTVTSSASLTLDRYRCAAQTRRRTRCKRKAIWWVNDPREIGYGHYAACDQHSDYENRPRGWWY